MSSSIIARKLTWGTIYEVFRLTKEGIKNARIAKATGLSVALIQQLRNGSYYSRLDDECQRAWQHTFGGVPFPRAPIPVYTFGGVPINPVSSPVTPPNSPDHHPVNTTAPVPQKLAPECLQHPEAVSSTPNTETKEDAMLLVSEGLKPETRQHFKLPRNPFVDDVQSCDDVFQTPSVRHVRAALKDCAMYNGFIAVVGESGSGKSTVAEDLEERIRIEASNVIIIRPYVLEMEENDQRGKTFKSAQIADAICSTLDPGTPIKRSSDARNRQAHKLLKASRNAGKRHLLLIEEAHCLPLATLKHLKRWIELKDGLQRLLGVALIGQQELRERLGGNNPQVREVAGRCEIFTLDPLDAELEGYLQHKFARFDLKLSAVFTPDAFDAIRARLIYIPRGGKPSDARSICFPLVVNNLVCRAMNIAARAGWPQVDAQVIASC